MAEGGRGLFLELQRGLWRTARRQPRRIRAVVSGGHRQLRLERLQAGQAIGLHQSIRSPGLGRKCARTIGVICIFDFVMVNASYHGTSIDNYGSTISEPKFKSRTTLRLQIIRAGQHLARANLSFQNRLSDSPRVSGREIYFVRHSSRARRGGLVLDHATVQINWYRGCVSCGLNHATSHGGHRGRLVVLSFAAVVGLAALSLAHRPLAPFTGSRLKYINYGRRCVHFARRASELRAGLSEEEANRHNER